LLQCDWSSTSSTAMLNAIAYDKMSSQQPPVLVITSLR
jgi:hypothetical protein